jgi:predicted PurR-regulated permease PerM
VIHLRECGAQERLLLLWINCQTRRTLEDKRGEVVGLVDNFLKPILIGSRARLPFVLVFFSILGGLKMYGILGIVLGPMMMGVALTFIRIYKEKYSDDRSA